MCTNKKNLACIEHFGSNQTSNIDQVTFQSPQSAIPRPVSQQASNNQQIINTNASLFKENKTSTKSQENVIHFQPKRDDIKNPGENPTPNDDRGEIPRFHRPFRG